MVTESTPRSSTKKLDTMHDFKVKMDVSNIELKKLTFPVLDENKA